MWWSFYQLDFVSVVTGTMIMLLILVGALTFLRDISVRGGPIDLNIASIDTKVGISIRSILA